MQAKLQSLDGASQYRVSFFSGTDLMAKEKSFKKDLSILFMKNTDICE